jgi:ubiquinone/menaquinone biosynthesis C-methylase UbiE
MIYYWIIFKKVFELAAKRMCKECKEYINEGSKILDLGCGSGIAGQTFAKFFKAEVAGTDIEDWRIVKMPFKKSCGIDIPFPDKSFDIVLISYVLHHSLDAAGLLNNAKKVAKDKIIIYEDIPEGFISKAICKLHSAITLIIHRGTNKPQFKTKKQWEELFAKLQLTVIFEKRVTKLFGKRHLFILRV